MRNIPNKTDNSGDTLAAGEFNSFNNELENAVTSADISLDGASGPDNDLNMLGKSMAAYGSSSDYYDDGGSANSYVLSRATNLQEVTKYYDGMKITFIAGNANTGASTVNVSSLGAKDLVDSEGNDLIEGDINEVDPSTAIYNLASDEFRLVEPVSNALNIKRNYIINGSFNVWQRSNTQTNDGYGSDDRWYNSHSGSSKTHSRQTFALGQTDVPDNPEVYSRTVVTSSAGASNFVLKEQRIESVETFASETVTISFWAKADANKNIAVEFLQFFGSGGSPSTSISITTETFALTTSWQKFTATVDVPSVSGKTLGSNGDDSFRVTFWFDAGSNFNSRTNSLGQQSGTFDISQVQVEKGRRATKYETKSIQEQLNECLYYYYKAGGDGTANSMIATGHWTSITNTWQYITFPVRMRTAPTAGYAGTPNIVNKFSYLPMTSLGWGKQTIYGGQLECGVAAGGVAGEGTQVTSGGSGTAYIDFTAEI